MVSLPQKGVVVKLLDNESGPVVEHRDDEATYEARSPNVRSRIPFGEHEITSGSLRIKVGGSDIELDSEELKGRDWATAKELIEHGEYEKFC